MNPNRTVTGILDCQAGQTASQCADNVLKILEERLTKILGLNSSTITILSNNAVLIIDSVIRIRPLTELRRRRCF